MENTMNDILNTLCVDDKPDGYYLHEDKRGKYVFHIVDRMPLHIYAIITETQATMAEELIHLENCLWIDGCDLWGYGIRIDCDTFSPKLIVNPEICKDPWPQEVVDLLAKKLEPEYEFYTIIHIFDIDIS